MTFTKEPLPLDALGQHLRDLGLGGDERLIARRLQDVGYYRLSPYWRFFRDQSSTVKSGLRPGTTIDAVWRLYTFDRELRLLALDALERVEVGVRARLVQRHVEENGPFGYANPDVVGAAHGQHYRRLVTEIEAELRRAVGDPAARHLTEPARHFAVTYGRDHGMPPLWLAAENFSFGDLVTLYKASPFEVQKAVARDFHLPAPVLSSWLLALQTVRNVCAHHGRMWNRTFGTRPQAPHSRPEWSSPLLGPSDRSFYIMSMLADFMGVLSDGSRWGHRFRALVVERYPEIEKGPMGLRAGWERHPVWEARLRDGD